MKRPYDDAARYSTETNRHPSSSKHGPTQSNTRAVKSGTKPGTKPGPKVNKMTGAKAGDTMALVLQNVRQQKKIFLLTIFMYFVDHYSFFRLNNI